MYKYCKRICEEHGFTMLTNKASSGAQSVVDCLPEYAHV